MDGHEEEASTPSGREAVEDGLRTPSQAAGSGEISRIRRQSTVPDHTDVTPHTLAPEDYHKALSSEPGLYAIGAASYA